MKRAIWLLLAGFVFSVAGRIIGGAGGIGITNYAASLDRPAPGCNYATAESQSSPNIQHPCYCGRFHVWSHELNGCAGLVNTSCALGRLCAINSYCDPDEWCKCSPPYSATKNRTCSTHGDILWTSPSSEIVAAPSIDISGEISDIKRDIESRARPANKDVEALVRIIDVLLARNSEKTLVTDTGSELMVKSGSRSRDSEALDRISSGRPIYPVKIRDSDALVKGIDTLTRSVQNFTNIIDLACQYACSSAISPIFKYSTLNLVLAVALILVSFV